MNTPLYPELRNIALLINASKVLHEETEALPARHRRQLERKYPELMVAIDTFIGAAAKCSVDMVPTPVPTADVVGLGKLGHSSDVTVHPVHIFEQAADTPPPARIKDVWGHKGEALEAAEPPPPPATDAEHENRLRELREEADAVPSVPSWRPDHLRD